MRGTHGTPRPRGSRRAGCEERLFNYGIPYPCWVSELHSKLRCVLGAQERGGRGAGWDACPLSAVSRSSSRRGGSGTGSRTCDPRGWSWPRRSEPASAAGASRQGCGRVQAGDVKCVSGYTPENSACESWDWNRAKLRGSVASLRVLRSPFKNIKRLLWTKMIFSLQVKATCCLFFFFPEFKTMRRSPNLAYAWCSNALARCWSQHGSSEGMWVPGGQAVLTRCGSPILLLPASVWGNLGFQTWSLSCDVKCWPPLKPSV